MNEKSKSILPWVIVGILALLLVGGGIYAYFDLNQPKTASAGQTQTGQRNPAGRNPAMRAASSILRLQADPQQALSADQKSKLKPILQDLINQQNPSQDYLTQAASSIEAVFTDAQRTYLSQNQGRYPGAGGGQGGQGGQGYQGGGQGGQGGQGFQGGQGNRPYGGSRTTSGQSFNLQDLYKRVLDSLQ